jgi:hypothetical protein
MHVAPIAAMEELTTDMAYGGQCSNAACEDAAASSDELPLGPFSPAPPSLP